MLEFRCRPPLGCQLNCLSLFYCRQLNIVMSKCNQTKPQLHYIDKAIGLLAFCNCNRSHLQSNFPNIVCAMRRAQNAHHRREKLFRALISRPYCFEPHRLSISIRAELRLHLSGVSSALCDLWLLLASMKGSGEAEQQRTGT